MKTLAAIVLALAACAHTADAQKDGPKMTHPTPAPASKDAALVDKIRAAVATRVVPEGIESKVGTPAAVNTATGMPLAALKKVNFRVDPAHEGEPLQLARAKAVVYWMRDVPGDDPHVVGVQVRDDGTATVFFAIIGPP